MNVWMYVIAIYQMVSWIYIIISIKCAKTDIELWGDELE